MTDFRDLNAKIAERVMGFKRWQLSPEICQHLNGPWFTTGKYFLATEHQIRRHYSQEAFDAGNVFECSDPTVPPYPDYDKEVPDYVTDYGAAFGEVIPRVRELVFSQRRKFFREIQELATPDDWKETDGSLIAWPDVLFRVTPEIVCKAALAAVEYPPSFLRE